MGFDPRLAVTFAVVAEELSFTRAAERLGVAQPWVSEQIRRLEDRLQLRLLARTSRHTELTAEGRAFLPYAQALAQANEAAQRWARDLRSAHGVLRLGAVDFVNAYPERSALIESFLSAEPQVDLQIVNGPADDLLRRLAQAELDAVIAFDTSAADHPRIRPAALICQRLAGVLAPQEHPIASGASARLSDLAGCVVVTSPGRSDPVALRATWDALSRHGAQLFPAPEANRATIENLARARRWSCLRWTTNEEPRQTFGDMVFLPLEGTPLRLQLAVLTVEGKRGNPLVGQLCRLAQELRGAADPSEQQARGPAPIQRTHDQAHLLPPPPS
ncbi:transcriptional regulator, LysR family [Phenylobacterium zucineum HLK1]|uniref:Transcriptional regulator, LysR family n=1 Tax=Phenylobacterium zucineum (strain HLK1) TaxID=450851 RepID=B4RGM4_PHEZH|nr:LysR family transcriptional regulator [Phenylobacterium zucineum]ACG78930.1 transcriptional regulator, LysR family [Phenylobacterium zucineum HLK1]